METNRQDMLHQFLAANFKPKTCEWDDDLRTITVNLQFLIIVSSLTVKPYKASTNWRGAIDLQNRLRSACNVPNAKERPLRSTVIWIRASNGDIIGIK